MVAFQQQKYVDTQPSNVIKLYQDNNDKTKKNKISNKPKGKSSEVYAFKTEEELNQIFSVLDKHIENATTPTNKKIWYRNKMMFIVGINIALRGSDLSQLKWNDFLESDGEFKDNTKIQPQKTRKVGKSGKFVFIYFNDVSKAAVKEYLKLYPYNNINDYIFESKKTDDGIQPRQIWNIVKSVAKEAGIKQNIGSHSLRKTFGYWVWHDAADKQEALVMLQRIFNHSSAQVTMAYIGIDEDDMAEVYERLNYGINCKI